MPHPTPQDILTQFAQLQQQLAAALAEQQPADSAAGLTQPEKEDYTMEVQSRFLTLQEVSIMLTIPLSTLRNQVCKGAKNPLRINGERVKITRINNRVRIELAEIQRLKALNEN